MKSFELRVEAIDPTWSMDYSAMKQNEIDQMFMSIGDLKDFIDDSAS